MRALICFLSIASFLFGSGSPGKAYISYDAQGFVSQVDLNTLSVSNTLPASSSSQHFGVAVSYPFLYLTNLAENTLSKIDIRTNTLVSTLEVGNAPAGLSITPDRTKALVVNAGSKTVSIVDLASFTILSQATLEGNPWNIAITPDGTQAFVSNTSESTVFCFDINAPEAVTSITVSAATMGVAVTPNGEKVLLTHPSESFISEIDVGSHAVSTFAVPETMFALAITPDGNQAFVTGNSTSKVYAISLPSHDFAAVDLGASALCVAITSDGRKVLFPTSDNTVGTLYVLDTTTREIVGTAAIARVPLAIAMAFFEPPENCRGTIHQRSKKYRYYLHTKWRASPSVGVTGYELYSRDTKIATIPSGQPLKAYPHFYAHHRKADHFSKSFLRRLQSRWKIRAVDSTTGLSSDFSSVQIHKP